MEGISDTTKDIFGMGSNYELYLSLHGYSSANKLIKERHKDIVAAIVSKLNEFTNVDIRGEIHETIHDADDARFYYFSTDGTITATDILEKISSITLYHQNEEASSINGWTETLGCLTNIDPGSELGIIDINIHFYLENFVIRFAIDPGSHLADYPLFYKERKATFQKVLRTAQKLKDEGTGSIL